MNIIKNYIFPQYLVKHYHLLVSLCFCFLFSCVSSEKENSFFVYGKTKLNTRQKEVLAESLKKQHEKYNPEKCLLSEQLTGWNYHTDAESGVYHEVRGSLYYAISLLDLEDKEYEQRAFDIVEKILTLQDTAPNSPSYGVWPYYEEEPLATKKSPIDYNWADFNAVSLLEIVLNHKDRIPQLLLERIDEAILRAARAIQKRNMGPHYTNIAIMGTYVTYITGHMQDINDLKEYANQRLISFYNYTIEKGGFSEYNSPTYTMVALEELKRMKKHIIEPEAKKMIDSLYETGWEIIARHFHTTSGQWAGPHSRSYNTFIGNSFYNLLYQSSDGAIQITEGLSDLKGKDPHTIPQHLYSYFLSPVYPRTETDVFENNEPQIIGTTYLTEPYVISSVNRSCMWNQRRPLSAYWGIPTAPHYLQVRMLHDDFDFSAATIFSDQQKNQILSAIFFSTNGGDKHVHIDHLIDGKFKAEDLRLRFELGNCSRIEELLFPDSDRQTFSFIAEGLKFSLKLYKYAFGKEKGYWEKGGDEKNSWVDYVIYSGKEKDFDLLLLDDATLGFTLSVHLPEEEVEQSEPIIKQKDGNMTVTLNKLLINVPVKPTTNAQNI